jgi:hypothetical protein
MRGVPYIENTLLHNLHQWAIPEFDPAKLALTGRMIPVRQMGISHATITETQPVKQVIYFKDGPGSAEGQNAGAAPRGNYPPSMLTGPMGHRTKGKAPKKKLKKEEPEGEAGRPIPLTEFVIEFAWQDVPPEKFLPEDPSVKKPAASSPGAPAAAAPSGTAGPAGATPQATAPPATTPATAPAAANPPGGPPAAAPAGNSPPAVIPKPNG